MRQRLLAGLVLAVAACTNLPSGGDGIVALEVLVPKVLVIAPDETVTLRARALNQAGDSVAADIRWFTIDTLTISVDAVTGLVTPLAETGTGRVQAGVGSLRSDPISITVRVPPTP